MALSYKELLNDVKAFIFDVDGVLTNGMVTIFPNGELVRNMNIKDGYALKSAVDAGYNVCIISGGSNEGVRTRLEGLGITDIYLGVHDKIEKYQEIIGKYRLEPKDIVYMGDDIPDYPVMELVGMPCAPQDAAPEIKAVAKYVSPIKGGEGCVRDIIEQVMRVQGKWNGKFYAKFD
ncbi:KdsC family phosphatase [Wenyingzhuangia marina]|uniref:3-deoxy-D-manno-octulosonate 8-phosphate phosphatase (KDO 8-P phosphatase) n=1 Tax=Wenyingzhuangia marina TaxID=1195760 RepID=A0A1M5U2H2_9FLAO|nr:HAD-IIIA family hydrolase [Wenyingzhuangia marina]GGF70024.1 3-deoxy-D-manno-octulosonate 8-phosphate phosphatase [Wenyingzhuangia marina]SHH56843.1 3-deoxy-D-manno-octulosonate 8-phosphate phosphatase (KDO 8-P phosphatase) [Wenyingzhuangia marina]